MQDRLIRIENEAAYALVYPEQGFQLHGFAVKRGGRWLDVIYGPPDGREPEDRRYGNPVLFPSVGVTTGDEPDRWSHAGRLLPMQQHGWARDAYWHVDAVSRDAVAGHLRPPTGMRLAFPFDHELRLRYRVEGDSLTLDAELGSQASAPFPYALGFHPYLRAPLTSQSDRSACLVRLPQGTRLRSGDGWRTIEASASPARPVSVVDPELPGSIVLAETGVSALEVEDTRAGLAVRVATTTGTNKDGDAPYQSFPVWVVWTAAPHAPYICLEPWTDAPNALQRARTRTIAPGAIHRYRMAISVRSL